MRKRHARLADRGESGGQAGQSNDWRGPQAAPSSAVAGHFRGLECIAIGMSIDRGWSRRGKLRVYRALTKLTEPWSGCFAARRLNVYGRKA